MFSKWKEIKKEMNIEKKHIYEIYKIGRDWKIHLRDVEQNIWIEFTFLFPERKIVGTYYDVNKSESGLLSFDLEIF